MKSIAIIGYGNVGETLAKHIYFSKKLELLWICSKHFNVPNTFPNLKLYSDISQIEFLPDAIFITTNDEQIETVSKNISDVFCEKLFSKIVIHTSGSFGLELLSSCEEYGAITIAAHPFQTFFSKDILCLNDIFWGIEISNKNYLTDINNLIASLNGHSFFLPIEIINNKALYHSIGVAVSNYVAGAIKLGTLLADQIKLPKKEFLIPIIKQTVDNCLNSIVNDVQQFPLTGPIVRKDKITIEKHIAALNNFPELQQSYVDFANGLKKIL